MTYRERKERRADRRDEWARKRMVKANAAGSRAFNMASVMQGEPIKVGHHSEGRHRRDVGRMDSLDAYGGGILTDGDPSHQRRVQHPGAT